MIRTLLKYKILIATMIVVSFSTNMVIGMYCSINHLIEENFVIKHHGSNSEHHDNDADYHHDQEELAHHENALDHSDSEQHEQEASHHHHHHSKDKHISGLIHFAEKDECCTKSVNNFYSFTKVISALRTTELHAAIIDLPFKSFTVSNLKLVKTVNAFYTDSGPPFVRGKLHIAHQSFLI